jgi:hypothetical protein
MIHEHFLGQLFNDMWHLKNHFGIYYFKSINYISIVQFKVYRMLTHGT